MLDLYDGEHLIAKISPKTLVFQLAMLNLAALAIDERVQKAHAEEEGLQLGTKEYDGHLAVCLQFINNEVEGLIPEGEEFEGDVLEYLTTVPQDELNLGHLNNFLNGGSSEQTD
jgi:hypothetical protein